MLIFPIMPRNAAANHTATMRQPLVIFVQFFLTDEMHRRIVIGKIIRHGLDFLLHLGSIRTIFQHHIAFTRMLFPRGKLRIFTSTHSSQSLFHRHRVLAGIGYTLNAADCIRMPLRNAAAPERIIPAVRQNRIAVHAGQREQPRVPAHRNNTHMAIFLGGLIHICKMLRNPRMRIKAVHHVEHFGIMRRLYRQIRCTATAENHDINLIFPFFHIADIDHRHAGSLDGKQRRVTAGKHRHQFQIIIGLYRAFHAPAQIAIT